MGLIASVSNVVVTGKVKFAVFVTAVAHGLTGTLLAGVSVMGLALIDRAFVRELHGGLFLVRGAAGANDF